MRPHTGQSAAAAGACCRWPRPSGTAAVVLTDGRTIRTKTASTGDRDKDDMLAAGWTAVRAADLSFVLTQLDRLGRGEIAGSLTGRLDTSRVAVTGHSMGGAAALQAARQDRRFDAVIDLDGYPHGSTSPSLSQPTLALTQAITPGTDPHYIPRSPRSSSSAPRRATGSPSPAPRTSPSWTAPCTCRPCPR